MPVGSFVNGVFRGMSIRDARDNMKRNNKMDDTRFEREGESHEWRRESHEMQMERARKAMARANAKGGGRVRPPSMRDEIGALYSDYGSATGGGAPAPAAAQRADFTVAPAAGGADWDTRNPNPFTGAPAPLSMGEPQPREMSALDARQAAPEAQPVQVADARPFTAPGGQPRRLRYVEGQGLVGVA